MEVAWKTGWIAPTCEMLWTGVKQQAKEDLGGSCEEIDHVKPGIVSTDP